MLTGAKGVNLWASFRTPPPQRSARLYQALVDTGLASARHRRHCADRRSRSSTPSPPRRPTARRSLRLEEAAVAEIDRVRARGHHAGELTKAKTQLRARLVFENDSITNIAHQLGYFATIASWRDYPRMAGQIECGHPRPGRRGRGPAPGLVQPHDRVVLAARTMTVLQAGQSRGLAPSREVLANGVTVLSKSTSVTPAVTLNASIRAGAVADPPDLSGVSHFVSKTIERGTETRSADQIAEDLDGRGVSLAVTLTRQVLSLTCTCLVEDFEPVLSLLADIIRNTTFPSGEVDSRRGEIITLIRQDEDSPAAVAVDGLMELLYGVEHPYGRTLRGTTRTVERIDSAVLKAFHRARITPSSVSLALVGDIDRTRAVDAATASFGPWAAPAARPIECPAVPAVAARRTRVIPMMNKSQADIAYGFTSILAADPAYYAYWLMNHILGQYSMGGRLGDSIRERQGMAYYVFSSLDANLVPGPLIDPRRREPHERGARGRVD